MRPQASINARVGMVTKVVEYRPWLHCLLASLPGKRPWGAGDSDLWDTVGRTPLPTDPGWRGKLCMGLGQKEGSKSLGLLSTSTHTVIYCGSCGAHPTILKAV